MGGRDAVVVVRHGVDQHPGHPAVPHGDVPHIAAPLGRALDLDAVGGVGDVAVPNLYPLHAAAHLAADGDAVAQLAGAVKDADVPGGAADAVALGVFAGLDGHHVVPGGEPAGEQRAALAGIGVPAVAVPHAFRAEGAVVGDDVLAVDHMDVPAGAVLQGQAGDAHVGAVAQVDEPSPHPAGDGIFVLAAGHQGGVLFQVRLQLLPFPFYGGQGQGAAAAPDGAMAIDAHMAAAGPALVAEAAQVQQALVTLLLDTLEPGPDPRGVVVGVPAALQYRSLLQIERHIAVQPQGAGEKDPGRKVDFHIPAAGVDGCLQGLGVQGLAVPHSAEVPRIQPGQPRSGGGPAGPQGPALQPDFQGVFGRGGKSRQGAVGVGHRHRNAPPGADLVTAVCRCPGGFVPVEGQGIGGGANADGRIVHGRVSFRRQVRSPAVWDGSFSIVAEATAAGKVKNRLVPCTNPGIPPVGPDTAILANFCRSFG